MIFIIAQEVYYSFQLLFAYNIFIELIFSFFQNDVLPKETGNNPILLIEKVILAIVVLWQLRESLIIHGRITELKNVFNVQLRVKTRIETQDADINSGNLINVESISNNSTHTRIKKSINKYLDHNYGATVNFNLIKDIIDREVAVLNEEINLHISFPLYLGLAATMVGIILGLFAVPELTDNKVISGIGAIIEGVKWAMGASLIGLACTSFLTVFVYKGAEKKVLSDKNDQLSYLQAILIPELSKAEESGIHGLRVSLDIFSSKTSLIVDQLNEIVLNTSNNIINQNKLIEKIEKMNVNKLTKANLELFDRLDESMIQFESFSDNLLSIENISNQLDSFAKRTTDIDKMVVDIHSSMTSAKNVLEFLSKHKETITKSAEEALETVNHSSEFFQKSIEKLNEEINNRIEALNTVINLEDSNFTDKIIKLEKSLKDVTDNLIDSFNQTYQNAIPQFDQLDNLEPLLATQEHVLKENREFVIKYNETVKSQSELILLFKEQLNWNKTAMTSILNELRSVEKALKGKQKTRIRKKNQKVNEVKYTKAYNVFEDALSKITSLFKNKDREA